MYSDTKSDNGYDLIDMKTTTELGSVVMETYKLNFTTIYFQDLIPFFDESFARQLASSSISIRKLNSVLMLIMNNFTSFLFLLLLFK